MGRGLLLEGAVTIPEIERITDPVERAKAAAAFIGRARGAIDDAQRIRTAAVTELLADGWSVRKVAATVGLSPARVQQIKPTHARTGLPSETP